MHGSMITNHKKFGFREMKANKLIKKQINFQYRILHGNSQPISLVNLTIRMRFLLKAKLHTQKAIKYFKNVVYLQKNNNLYRFKLIVVLLNKYIYINICFFLSSFKIKCLIIFFFSKYNSARCRSCVSKRIQPFFNSELFEEKV